MTRDQLIVLVERIMCADGASEAENDRLVARFEQSVPHPRASDLIFWPPDSEELTAREIVDRALAYRSITLGPADSD